MRFIFIIFLFCCLSSGSIQCVEPKMVIYTIRPVLRKGSLGVDLEFVGNKNGKTKIILPSSFMGEEHLEQEIIGLHCTSALIEDTETPHIKLIHHNSCENLKITYCIQTKERKKGFGRSYLEKDYFHFLGETFFVIPEIEIEKEINIILNWEGFSSDWTLANSFGIQKRKQKLFLSLNSLKNGIYLGGDWKFLSCGNENSPVFIALRKNSVLPEKSLNNLVQIIINSQRGFWNDWDFPYYLVSICEIGDDQYKGGTAVSNALTIFIQENFLSSEKDASWKWLETTLSHEHFHLWNGLKICFEPSEDYVRWFMEGFTDFYALTLNHRAKLIKNFEYVEKINLVLDEYFTSSVRNATEEDIQNFFWKDRRFMRLPYLKGCLLALYWDSKIKSDTCGNSSLDDVMRALLNESREKNQHPFSQEDLQKFLHKFIENASQDIDCYIIRGETLPVNPNAFDGFSLEWDERSPRYKLID